MKRSNRLCSLKIQSDDGRELKGTAAQLHYVKLRGGWDQYHRELYREIAQAVALKVADALSVQAMAQQAHAQPAVVLSAKAVEVTDIHRGAYSVH